MDSGSPCLFDQCIKLPGLEVVVAREGRQRCCADICRIVQFDISCHTVSNEGYEVKVGGGSGQGCCRVGATESSWCCVLHSACCALHAAPGVLRVAGCNPLWKYRAGGASCLPVPRSPNAG